MAPIIPFMCEFIWQKLVRRVESNEELSVHLKEFEGAPEIGAEAKEALENTKLIRKVITLALKLRNEKRIKVRQPLSTLMVVLASENQKGVIEAAQKTILEEVNAKRLEFLQNPEGLVTARLNLDFKKAGEVLKEELLPLKLALDTAPVAEQAAALTAVREGRDVRFSGFKDPVPAALFSVQNEIKEGIHLVEDREMVVALDITIPAELVREGIYRELVRHCQVLRKEAGFKVEQRIHMAINAEDETINSVLAEYKERLMAELLATEFTASLDKKHIKQTISIDETKVIVQLLGI
jgi:isoleucyl-tRNA synthetase